jgi:predicted methyltransferase
MEENVDRVIKQIFNTLKPDGILGIVDHSAEENSGIKHAQDIKGIHRIEEAYVIKTMLAHGFIFDGESNALNQANDNGTQAFFSDQFKGKPTNRFMLRFRKPPVH